jgi:hypothetical protein
MVGASGRFSNCDAQAGHSKRRRGFSGEMMEMQIVSRRITP